MNGKERIMIVSFSILHPEIKAVRAFRVRRSPI